jgi:large subunit ribosomal protein L13
MGDFVIVVNADKFDFSQKRLEDKLYHRHSGYPGGLRNQLPCEEMLQKHPDRVIVKLCGGCFPITDWVASFSSA